MGRPPEMLSCAPKPRLPRDVPVSKPIWVSMALTPGERVASDAQSRPFKGNSRMVVDSTSPLMTDEVSCTNGAASVTSTS